MTPASPVLHRRLAGPLSVALLALACTPAAPPTHTLQGRGLGTTWTVTWGPGDATRAAGVDDDAVGDAVVAALAEVDGQMSTWHDSELTRARAAHGPVPISEGTARVVREALWLAQASGGAFDPTVEPLIELWGFHGERRTALPSQEELDVARAALGWVRVIVGRDATGHATLDTAGAALDLSAIAKGYAVDRISENLSALGLADHLVEVGGEVRVQGAPPAGEPWTVGVDRPVPSSAPGTDLVAVLAPVNAAVATSGNYRQRYVLDGQEIHHTLDPRTGWPATSGVLSATVIAPTCATADALATALMVLGPEGLPLVTALPGTEAWLLTPSDDGALHVEQTPGFALHLVTESTTRVAASNE